MQISTARVWAQPLTVEQNTVRQLLVEAETLDIIENDDGLTLSNKYGTWPARRDSQRADGEALTGMIPRIHSSISRVRWEGSRALLEPSTVTASHHGTIGFRDPTEPHSLRRPQIGALHSVIGYWTSALPDPGVVVMPTGTGKTETMLALFIATRPAKLLVVVPTSVLRDQIAAKFETLGVLQREQVVTRSALRPCVGKLEHGLKQTSSATQLAGALNVLVTTPHALNACSPDARDALLATFSHLMVDEAHHAPAPSWTAIIDTFSDRHVLLFTATPFREDGKTIAGRTIYRFPLREAQQDGYFTTIDYKTVSSIGDTDSELADLAIARLRHDLAAGYDHIVMARAKSVQRAKDLVAMYRTKAPDLGPDILFDKLSSARRTSVRKALDTRECKIIVCVDMLGEGFDLPSLKIAAVHDVKKSLSPMIQFIGRFTRTVNESSTIGTAAAFVAQDPSNALSPLRDLLREDADWNLLLRDITDRASQTAEDIRTFDTSFAGGPDEVSTASLEPKMSAIAHRAPIPAWNPEAALDHYGGDRVLDGRIAVSVGSSLAWFVLEHRDRVPWGDVQTLGQLTYELIVMYFDQHRRILYIHSSENNGNYADLAEAVLGEGTEPVTGPKTFRVLAHVDRLIPTNIGLLDARDHFNRFSMYVGSDVLEALNEADKQGKSQTHIATSGFSEGERITISAALSGRIWSMATAPNLLAWKIWCDVQGAKLLDDEIDLKEVLGGFIIPQDVRERPPHVLLGAEWSWEFFTGTGSTTTISYNDKAYTLADVEFTVDDYGTKGCPVLIFAKGGWLLSGPPGADWIYQQVIARLRIWTTPRRAYQTPLPLRRQLRRMFQDFRCASACSTRARMLLCTVFRSSFHSGNC